MERSPSALRQSVEARAKRKAVTDIINSQFPQYINEFRLYLQRERGGEAVNVFFYDAHAAFTRILDAPTDYGFTSATDWGSSSRVFWGDTYHPGTYGHAILAEDIDLLLAKEGYWDSIISETRFRMQT